MPNFDLAVLRTINAYAGHSPRFDSVVVLLANNQLFKAGPALMGLWWLWAVKDPKTQERRRTIVATLIAAFVAVAVSVSLTHLLPNRPRPLIDPTVAFVLPYSMQPQGWDRASSLPSDHAALFFALAGGLFAISRSAGLLAAIYALVCIALPRAYLGLHYASDLLVGAAIGLAAAAVFVHTTPAQRLAERLLAYESRNAPAFYALMFLVTYQIADLFYGARDLMRTVGVLVHGVG